MPHFAVPKPRAVLLGMAVAGAVVSTAVAPALAAEPLLELRWSAPFSISSHEEGPEALSCPSSSFCVATDLSGNVMTSSNPSGGLGAWTKAHISDSTPELVSASCPSASFCAVAGVAFGPPTFTPHSEVWTSTDPTGGPSAWHGTALGGETYVKSISCPSANFCAVVGQTGIEGEEHPRSEVWTSSNPAGGPSAWHAAVIDAGNLVNAIGCPSSGLCLVVDQQGNVLTSTNPTGGSAAWSAPQSIGPQTNGIPVSLNAVSCVGIGFCAVSSGYDYIDTEQPGTGNLVYSFNPTGGASAWGASPPMADGLFSLACPGAGECLSVDYSGNVYNAASSIAEATGFGWTVQELEPVNYFRVFVGAACPSTEHCFLLDSEGNVFVGHPYEEVEEETPPAEESKPPAETPHEEPKGHTENPPPVLDGIDGLVRVAPLTTAQLVALLRSQLTPHGKAASIQNLLKHGGLTMPFTTPEAGTVSVGWYFVPKGATLARHAKPVLVASGKLAVSAAEAAQLKLKLTAVGKRQLKHAKRVKLVMRGTLTASRGGTVSTTADIRLGR
jgi:hypothetical protein